MIENKRQKINGWSWCLARESNFGGDHTIMDNWRRRQWQLYFCCSISNQLLTVFCSVLAGGCVGWRPGAARYTSTAIPRPPCEPSRNMQVGLTITSWNKLCVMCHSQEWCQVHYSSFFRMMINELGIILCKCFYIFNSKTIVTNKLIKSITQLEFHTKHFHEITWMLFWPLLMSCRFMSIYRKSTKVLLDWLDGWN